MVISSYVKWLEMTMNKQDVLLLMEVCHEIGNLYYSNNQIDEARVHWEQAINALIIGKDNV